MSYVIVRHPRSQTTHEVWGSAPGWALCSDYIPAAPALPEDTAVDCPGCRKSPEASAAASDAV